MSLIPVSAPGCCQPCDTENLQGAARRSCLGLSLWGGHLLRRESTSFLAGCCRFKKMRNACPNSPRGTARWRLGVVALRQASPCMPQRGSPWEAPCASAVHPSQRWGGAAPPRRSVFWREDPLQRGLRPWSTRGRVLRLRRGYGECNVLTANLLSCARVCRVRISDPHRGRS